MKKKKLLAAMVFIIGLVCAQFPINGAAAQRATSDKVDFAGDIEPIFRRHCYQCHGSTQQSAGLRLDSRASALAKVIRPGRAAESALYTRIAGATDQARMPLGGQLDLKQIALIKTWIDQGAEWPAEASAGTGESAQHWAFIAPERPRLPGVNRKRWARNPIDSFVLARLEKETLSPAAEADRATLLRRLSLDLRGLPPTIEEVDSFLRDRSSDAYEKQVERFLGSVHFGERWGRQWLDAARYADSDGYEKDKPRQVWFYRDWVIDAINRDLPYDQFVIEQIAGDLLPSATQSQVTATGFLRNSMINEEGGIDPEQFRMEAMFDRMDAIGKSILGLTIQCAQCHNHKYDPLRQEDYYRMFAFLNNSHEGNVAVYTPDELMKRAEILRHIREVEIDLQHRTPDWRKRMDDWEEQVGRNQPDWIVIRPAVVEISTGGQKYMAMGDGSFLAQGYAPTKQRAKFTVRTELQDIKAFRLELLNDPNLPMGGPGRSITGTCALTEFEVWAAPASAPDKPVRIELTNATADITQSEKELGAIFDDKTKRRRITGPVDFAIDKKDETAWGIEAGPGRSNQPRKAVFASKEPISNEGGTLLTFYLVQNHGGWNSDDNQNNNLGRFRLSITTAASATADLLPSGVREILSVPRDKRTPAQIQSIFSYWRTTVPEWRDADRRIEGLWREHPEGSSQLIMSERIEPRETHILMRGDFLKPERSVTPGVPGFLHPLPNGATPDRLAFARWLVDRKSPTTARALVNRIWQSYFGTGLVATSEDLGKQSEAPSHRELLDWLAVELMEKGWSVKHIHRLIVTSSTYRQSSRTAPGLQARDPLNRLLARGPRLRVDAEVVRDIALSASGLLNPKVGGPSVFPPAPDLLFLPPVSYGPKSWNESKDENRYRRAIYTFRYRSVPYPALQVFDAPNGDASCPRRSRSNTPLQALTTLNETLFVEAARALALKALKEGGSTDAQRLTYAFRRVLARRPAAAEASEMLGFLNRQRSRFLAGELNPWNLVTNDPDKPFHLPAGSRMEDLAAWTALSRVLLNLDEAITKE